MRLFWMELYKLLRRKAFLAGLFGALAILLLYFCVGIVGEERSTKVESQIPRETYSRARAPSSGSGSRA